MSDPSGDAIEVLSGSAGTDLRWVVAAYGDNEDLYTLLRVYRGERNVVAGSGLFGLRFAAAALPDGEQPAGLRAEREGTVLESVPQRMPRQRGPGRP